jgi:GxxExxY protein
MDEAGRVAEPGGDYRFEPLSAKVIGAAISVHKELGPGFREEVYENALCLELDRRGLSFSRQVVISVHYNGVLVGDHQLDIVVEDLLVLELKAVSELSEVHQAQLLAYLRAADLRVGLLLNFGELPLGIKRLVNQYRG